MEDSFEKDVIAQSKNLRAFAISLAGNGDRADDLVQDTLLRAIANKDSFKRGTNLPAWLFTILRNLFRTEYRKRRREVEDVEGNYAKTLKTQPNQIAHLEYEDFRAALEKLPADQRDALVLVGASGFSYADAAAIMNCAAGTIKSRVNRARAKLHELLGAFDLRELNKKSWKESDDSLPVDSPLAKKRKTGIWRETEKTSKVTPFFHPPLEPLPVKRFTPKEIAAFVIPKTKAAKTPEPYRKKEKTPLPPKAAALSIRVDGTLFELIGTCTLPDGKTQQLFRAA